MQEIKTESFDSNGTNYEIKLFKTKDGFQVKSFKDGKMANPYTYKVDILTKYQYESFFREKVTGRLINLQNWIRTRVGLRW